MSFSWAGIFDRAQSPTSPDDQKSGHRPTNRKEVIATILRMLFDRDDVAIASAAQMIDAYLEAGEGDQPRSRPLYVGLHEFTIELGLEARRLADVQRDLLAALKPFAEAADHARRQFGDFFPVAADPSLITFDFPSGGTASLRLSSFQTAERAYHAANPKGAA